MEQSVLYKGIRCVGGVKCSRNKIPEEAGPEAGKAVAQFET